MMVVKAVSDMAELGTGEEEQYELLQLPLKQQQQQQQLQRPAATPHFWTSQLVLPLVKTGSESTAQQQTQEQRQQSKTKRESMVVDEGKNMVGFETGEKGWFDDLFVKLYFQPCLSCSIKTAAAKPIDVCARPGVGTRWLVAMEDVGCRRHGHPSGEPFPPFSPN